MPNIAKESFYIDIVSSEIQNTNNIEGVESRREDIVYTNKEVIKNKIKNKNNNLKFLSIVKSYTAIKNINDNSINNDSTKKIKDIRDIRKIYDSITA